MNRRQLLKMIAVATGGAVIGMEALLDACTTNTRSTSSIHQVDIDLLNEVADIILPPTQTPGAKDANVGQIMAVMVRDCYTPKDQEIFYTGLQKIDDICRDQFSNEFMKSSRKQRQSIITQLDKKTPRYYIMIKQLTLFGYFTSEQGMTKSLAYHPVPGKYIGCTDYKKGDKMIVRLNGRAG